MIKKILFGLLILLVILQFFQPKKNNEPVNADRDIETRFAYPPAVAAIIKPVCYDCHSNKSEHPWYYHFQPVGWWLAHHIEEGKQELNFNEFLSYSPKKQKHKLEEMIEMVEKEEMPLASYTYLHKDSRLSEAQRTILINWAKETLQKINTE